MDYGFQNQNLATSMAMKRLLGIGAANQPYPAFNFAGNGATLPQENPTQPPFAPQKTPGAWLPQENPIFAPEGREPRPFNTAPHDMIPEGRVPRPMPTQWQGVSPEGRVPRPMPTPQAGPDNQNLMRRGVKNPMFLY